jgi:oligo-1,6-glucosidase
MSDISKGQRGPMYEEKAWWKEAVVYQLYPRSFADSNGDGIGDLKGIIGRLDYLKWLGVDIIWLNPVYKSPDDDGGYDISDYRAIHPDFGTMEDFDHLLEEMHRRDLKLVMDLVVNHSSDEHSWFLESSKGADSPCADYYIWKKPAADGGPPNDWLSFFEGSAWEYHKERGAYYLHLFSRKQPDLNWENPRLREEVYEVMRFWLDKGIDGFRMDVINLISKNPGFPEALPGSSSRIRGGEHFINGPKVVEYLSEMHREVLADRDVMTVGETPDVSPEIGLHYVGKPGGPLDLLFQFEHMDIDYGPEGYWDIGLWKPAELFSTLARWQRGMEGKGWNSLFLNNHDQPRQVSRLGNDKEYWRESAKLLAIFNHTLKGTPFIYQGEEIGMVNTHIDNPEELQDIGAKNFYTRAMSEGMDRAEAMRRINYRGRDNARTPMQWDGTAYGGFSDSSSWIPVNPRYRKINVQLQKDDPESVLSTYRHLIALRKTYPVFVYGRFNEIAGSDGGPIIYSRRLEDEELLIILNWGDFPADLAPADLDPAEPGQGVLKQGGQTLRSTLNRFSKSRLLISSYPDTAGNPQDIEQLRPWEALVYYMCFQKR